VASDSEAVIDASSTIYVGAIPRRAIRQNSVGGDPAFAQGYGGQAADAHLQYG
jgi:hypothetical protein